ncbi:MAG: hypothetical protein EBX33_10545 [Synechococcaceae bacterium WB8_1A_041]|nr:hypothetical protein [Synechococcaceae bacterium WB8_1A_041]
MLLLMLAGAALSYWLGNSAVAIASVSAFLISESLDLAALCHRRREQDPGGRPDQRLTATQGQASGQVSVVSIKKRLPEVNTNQQY